ncbi:MAG: DUF3027 domain-containing protein [Candidatus Nanopelagicales bacterium]
MAEGVTRTDTPDHDESVPDELLTVVVGQGGDDTGEQSPPTGLSWPVDEPCAAAIDVARSALLEETDASVVGDHMGLVADGPMVVTHFFEGSVPGYAGWQWAVTVTRAPDSDHVTVDETALLPDGSALLAPAWVPWRQRIEAGDLGTGDVMVTDADDPRLVPGMSANDLPDPDADEHLRPDQWELGLGRQRLLSPEGRREAAQRWYREVGPRAALARGADLKCATCGFLLLIGGPLGQGFGVCANGYSPVDGRIVALNFGCGAHSETSEQPSVGVAETVIDEMSYDDMGRVEEPAPEGVESATSTEDSEPEAQEQGSVTQPDEDAGTASTQTTEGVTAADPGESGAVGSGPSAARSGEAAGTDSTGSPQADVQPRGPADEGPLIEGSTSGATSDPDKLPSTAQSATDHATMHEPESQEGT